jgi:hypothetical protein
MWVKKSVQFKIHRDSDGGGDVHFAGRSRAEPPTSHRTQRRIIEVGVTRGSVHRHGGGITGVAYGDHEKDNTLPVFHTGLLGIDRWRIVEVIRLSLTGSFLPSAWSL